MLVPHTKVGVKYMTMSGIAGTMSMLEKLSRKLLMIVMTAVSHFPVKYLYT